MWKVALAAVLVAFATATASASTPEQEAYRAIRNYPVDLVIEPDARVNAGFSPPGIACDPYWGLCTETERPTVFLEGDWSAADPEMIALVISHELGHWHQWRAGLPFDEWDADVFGANLMCREGHDAIYAFERVIEFITVHYAIDPANGHDNEHGSWVERLANVRANAGECHRYQEPQA